MWQFIITGTVPGINLEINIIAFLIILVLASLFLIRRYIEIDFGALKDELTRIFNETKAEARGLIVGKYKNPGLKQDETNVVQPSEATQN